MSKYAVTRNCQPAPAHFFPPAALLALPTPMRSAYNKRDFRDSVKYNYL